MPVPSSACLKRQVRVQATAQPKPVAVALSLPPTCATAAATTRLQCHTIPACATDGYAQWWIRSAVAGRCGLAVRLAWHRPRTSMPRHHEPAVPMLCCSPDPCRNCIHNRAAVRARARKRRAGACLRGVWRGLRHTRAPCGCRPGLRQLHCVTINGNSNVGLVCDCAAALPGSNPQHIAVAWFVVDCNAVLCYTTPRHTATPSRHSLHGCIVCVWCAVGLVGPLILVPVGVCTCLRVLPGTLARSAGLMPRTPFWQPSTSTTSKMCVRIRAPSLSCCLVALLSAASLTG